MNKFHTYQSLIAATDMREEVWEGKDYLVVPIVALVEGVIQGALADKPELVRAEEMNQPVEAWNGRPVTIDHSESQGHLVPAGDPKILEAQQIGTMFNAKMDEKALKVEAWLDIAKIEEMGGDAAETLERIRANEQVEVSTGYFSAVVPSEGKYNGEAYFATHENIKPDHLAILSAGSIGACSWEDGCGVRINKIKEDKDFVIESITFDRDSFKSPHACHAWLRDNNLSELAGTVHNVNIDKGKFNVQSALKGKDLEKHRVICLKKDEEGKCQVKLKGGILSTNTKGIKSKTFFENYSGLVEFRENAELSDVDLRHALYAALEANGEDWFSITGVFSTSVIFERGYGNLYKQFYSIAEDGSMALNDDAFAVRPVTEFVPIVVNSEVELSKEKLEMNKEELIKSLIANVQTKYTEEDSTFLNTLSAEQLDKMVPLEVKAPEPSAEEIQAAAEAEATKVEAAKQAEAAKQTEEGATDAPDFSGLTPEAALAMLPPGIQEVLSEGLQLQQDRKSFLIKGLVENPNCEYKEDELQKLSANELTRMSKLAGVQADYSGQASMRAHKESNEIPPSPKLWELGTPGTPIKQVN